MILLANVGFKKSPDAGGDWVAGCAHLQAGPPGGGGAEGTVARVLVGRSFAHDVSRAKGLCSDGG